MAAVDKLVADYEKCRPTYDAFTSNLAGVLKALVQSESINHSLIESRTKDIDSFHEKLERPEKGAKYENVSDITDLSGVRIVTYLSEEYEQVCRIIKSNFEVDEKNSINKEATLNPDQFGYLSAHYIVSYKNDRLKLPDFKQFAGLKAEIQVRTILQHAWAAIDWRLRYGSEIEVPKELRRKLYRLSALLETADNEFSDIYTNVSTLTKSYEDDIKAKKYDIEINKNSIEVFLRSDDAVTRYLSQINSRGVATVKVKIDSRLLSLLNALEISDIKTIRQLRDLIIHPDSDRLDKLQKIYEKWNNKTEASSRFSIEGALRAYVILSSTKDEAKQILNTYKFTPPLMAAFNEVMEL